MAAPRLARGQQQPSARHDGVARRRGSHGGVWRQVEEGSGRRDGAEARSRLLHLADVAVREEPDVNKDSADVNRKKAGPASLLVKANDAAL